MKPLGLSQYRVAKDVGVPPLRISQKGVDVVLINTGLAFTLDSCQSPIMTLCYDIYANIATITPGPFTPAPDLRKLRFVKRIRTQHLGYKGLEGPPPVPFVGVSLAQLLENVSKATHLVLYLTQ